MVFQGWKCSTFSSNFQNFMILNKCSKFYKFRYFFVPFKCVKFSQMFSRENGGDGFESNSPPLTINSSSELIPTPPSNEVARAKIHKLFDYLYPDNFRPKIKICQKLVRNWNFGPKSKFWDTTEILVENRNFGPKSKIWYKNEILVENRNFGRNSKFWSKIEILVENRNFGRKSKFWSKISNFEQRFNLATPMVKSERQEYL